MTVTIGPLQPPEVPALCELFQRVFSVTLTPEVRHWKYEQGPRLGSVSLVARDATGALLGHVGALVFPGVCQGRPLPMAQVCDVMVAPSARGGVDAGGVYGRLMAALQAELAQAYPGVFAYGFAGIRPYKLGARMGLYRAVQPCRMGFYSAQGLPAQPGEPGKAAAATAPSRQARRQWPAPWAMAARPLTWDAPALGRLWQLLGPRSAGPLVQRTPAYLQRRYAGHPQHRYQAWALRRWGLTQGWVVTRSLPDGSLCIVDSLLPNAVTARNLAALLARTEASMGSWDIETEASARLEPIMGCEVRVDRWHSDRVNPHFQPGDTDVF